MRYRKQFAFFFVGTFAVVAIAATLNSQKRVVPKAYLSAVNATTGSSLGVRAYTNYPDTDYGDCFKQSSPPDNALYFKVYAGFPLKTVTLDLYQYSKDGSLSPMQTTPTVHMVGNMALITLQDSQPPHLGAGPYAAVISASGSEIMPSHLATTSNGEATFYYDTYNPRSQSYKDCWRENLPPHPR